MHHSTHSSGLALLFPRPLKACNSQDTFATDHVRVQSAVEVHGRLTKLTNRVQVSETLTRFSVEAKATNDKQLSTKFLQDGVCPDFAVACLVHCTMSAVLSGCFSYSSSNGCFDAAIFVVLHFKAR